MILEIEGVPAKITGRKIIIRTFQGIGICFFVLLIFSIKTGDKKLFGPWWISGAGCGICMLFYGLITEGGVLIKIEKKQDDYLIEVSHGKSKTIFNSLLEYEAWYKTKRDMRRIFPVLFLVIKCKGGKQICLQQELDTDEDKRTISEKFPHIEKGSPKQSVNLKVGDLKVFIDQLREMEKAS